MSLQDQLLSASVVPMPLTFLDPTEGSVGVMAESLSKGTIHEKGNNLLRAVRAGHIAPPAIEDNDDLDNPKNPTVIGIKAVSRAAVDRESILTILAPSYLWIRGRLLAEYRDSALNDTRFGFDVASGVNLRPLKRANLSNWHRMGRSGGSEASQIVKKFSMLPNVDNALNLSENAEITTTSNGVFLWGEEDGPVKWDCWFSAAWELYPASPYGDNAPSPRSLAHCLMDELNAQQDETLIAILASIVTGIWYEPHPKCVLYKGWMYGALPLENGEPERVMQSDTDWYPWQKVVGRNTAF